MKSCPCPARIRSVRVGLSEQEYAVLAAAAAKEGLALGAFAAQASFAAAQGRVVSEYAVVRVASGARVVARREGRADGCRDV